MDSERFATTPLHETFGMIVEAKGRGPLSALPRDEVAALFGRHGALLFRGFDTDSQAFVEFTSAYCEDFSTYRGGGFRWGSLDREKIDNNETLMSVTGSTQSFGLPLHGEMYYMSQRPSVLWFYCETPPSEAGETTLCSGAELYRHLGEPEREFFRRNRLKYTRRLTGDEWRLAFQMDDPEGLRRWCEENDSTIAENPDGSVTIEYVAPAVQGDPEAGPEVFINSLLIVHSAEQALRAGFGAKLSGLPREASPLVVRTEGGEELPADLIERVGRVGKDLTAKVAWEKGDVLMIDNRRIMHGRKSCHDRGRRIYVRMGEPSFAL